MKRLISITGISLTALFLFLNCGGGGSEGGGGVGDLQGTWSGWIADQAGSVAAFTLEVDGSGNVLDAQIGVSQIGTGHINEGWDESVFHVLYSDASMISHGILIVDDQYSHAIYGDYGSPDSHYYSGVLEKGMAGASAYTMDDIVASYPVGGAYEGSAGLWEGDDLTMTVGPAPALAITGNSPNGPFSGSFDTYEPDYGLYTGNLTSTGTTYDIRAFVSPDGTAVAAFVNDSDIVPDFLEDFILLGFKK
jgi:hypothetical protein